MILKEVSYAHHLFDYKYIKNSNIVKFYYKFKITFFIWIYVKM